MDIVQYIVLSIALVFVLQLIAAIPTVIIVGVVAIVSEWIFKIERSVKFYIKTSLISFAFFLVIVSFIIHWLCETRLSNYSIGFDSVSLIVLVLLFAVIWVATKVKLELLKGYVFLGWLYLLCIVVQLLFLDSISIGGELFLSVLKVATGLQVFILVTSLLYIPNQIDRSDKIENDLITLDERIDAIDEMAEILSQALNNSFFENRSLELHELTKDIEKDISSLNLEKGLVKYKDALFKLERLESQIEEYKKFEIKNATIDTIQKYKNDIELLLKDERIITTRYTAQGNSYLQKLSQFHEKMKRVEEAVVLLDERFLDCFDLFKEVSEYITILKILPRKGSIVKKYKDKISGANVLLRITDELRISNIRLKEQLQVLEKTLSVFSGAEELEIKALIETERMLSHADYDVSQLIAELDVELKLKTNNQRGSNGIHYFVPKVCTTYSPSKIVVLSNPKRNKKDAELQITSISSGIDLKEITLKSNIKDAVIYFSNVKGTKQSTDVISFVLNNDPSRKVEFNINVIGKMIDLLPTSLATFPVIGPLVFCLIKFILIPIGWVKISTHLNETATLLSISAMIGAVTVLLVLLFRYYKEVYLYKKSLLKTA